MINTLSNLWNFYVTTPILYTVHFTHSICIKDLKRAFLPKYIIHFLHLYNCWCISVTRVRVSPFYNFTNSINVLNTFALIRTAKTAKKPFSNNINHFLISSYNNGFFSTANYEVLKYLDHHIKAEKSNHNSDWIAGLEVSIDYIKRHVEKSPGPVGDKAIAIFSDLGCPSKFEEKFDSLVEKVSNAGIEIHLL